MVWVSNPQNGKHEGWNGLLESCGKGIGNDSDLHKNQRRRFCSSKPSPFSCVLPLRWLKLPQQAHQRPPAGPPKATSRSLEGHPLITSRPPNDFRLIQQILPRCKHLKAPKARVKHCATRVTHFPNAAPTNGNVKNTAYGRLI